VSLACGNTAASHGRSQPFVAALDAWLGEIGTANSESFHLGFEDSLFIAANRKTALTGVTSRKVRPQGRSAGDGTPGNGPLEFFCPAASPPGLSHAEGMGND
jgi:hypothetical protein